MVFPSAVSNFINQVERQDDLLEIAMMLDVAYAVEPQLDVDEFIDVLVRSTLGQRRPLGHRETMEGMLRNADVIISARQNGRLVGVSRAITDFSYCTYLADLAVDAGCQRKGIGRQLIQETHAVAGLHTTLILLSAPAAVTYYPHIGLQAHPSCWTIPGQLPAAPPAFPQNHDENAGEPDFQSR